MFTCWKAEKLVLKVDFRFTNNSLFDKRIHKYLRWNQGQKEGEEEKEQWHWILLSTHKFHVPIDKRGNSLEKIKQVITYGILVKAIADILVNKFIEPYKAST